VIRFPEAITAETFLREYWQKKPLLIPQGLADVDFPLEPDELAGLSLEEEIESRLVLEQGFERPWELHHGPFDENTYASLPQSPWTLLVQAVDLWLPEVRAIINHFPFLPRWRIDDIMVSYATDGGSVGPHFDYYDVFLIQGRGNRRWSIGGHCDEHTPLRSDTPLKILQDFQPDQSWLLEPGDILYLPPGIAHHGVADGECMTYSLGFRAPTAGEMLDDLATEVLSRGSNHFYRDPALTPTMATDRIDPAFVQQARKLLMNVLDDDTLLADWFSHFMTRPKYPELQLDDPALRRIAVSPTGKTFIDGE
jgi:50S ribosomal protein L16 3-hydroxylase